MAKTASRIDDTPSLSTGLRGRITGFVMLTALCTAVVVSSAGVSFVSAVYDQGFSFGGLNTQIEIDDSATLNPGAFTVTRPCTERMQRMPRTS